MTIITDLALAILLGGILAAGILAVLAALPRWRAASLMTRIGPYVRDAVEDERLPRHILPRVGLLPSRARGLRVQLRGLLLSATGGAETLNRRLEQAGLAPDAARFRGRQLAMALIGLAAGAVLLIALALLGKFSAQSFFFPVFFTITGVFLPDILLTARARTRTQRLSDELPTTLEFLALCLSAGEGLHDAITRVGAVGSGELTEELRAVILAVRTGSPLAEALGQMAQRLCMPSLSRATDQIVAALEHGAPLATVLHAQAGDAREEAKQLLIEQAGRREILMMLPVVFLILPLSVLFALFPGIFMLQVGLG